MSNKSRLEATKTIKHTKADAYVGRDKVYCIELMPAVFAAQILRSNDKHLKSLMVHRSQKFSSLLSISASLKVALSGLETLANKEIRLDETILQYTVICGLRANAMLFCLARSKGANVSKVRRS